MRGVSKIDPVLDLPLSEGSGTTVYDRSGLNNHGTIYGATWQKIWRDWILSFDGVDDYVEVPHSASLNFTKEMTVVAWVKYGYPTTRFEVIVGKGQPVSGEQYWGLIEHDQGFPHFEFWDGANWYYVSSNVYVEVGVWYFVVATYDSSQMKIYVNGELKNTTSCTIPIPTNNRPLMVGKRYDGGNFNGLIGEVRIFRKALTAEQISALYNLFRGELRKPPT
jgi:hypothetical protein